MTRSSQLPDAWDEAVRLLVRRDRSASEVRAELALRGRPEAVVDAILARLVDLGYVDDKRLAADLAERLVERQRGSLQVEAALTARGFDPAAIAAAVANSTLDEIDRARLLIASRFPEGLAEPRTRARAARFLHGRGFPEAAVLAIIGEDW